MVYQPQGVNFDGSTHMTRGADLTGAADGRLATGSFWFRTTGTADAVYQNAAGTVGVAISSFGRVNVFGYDTGFSFGFDAQTSVANDGEWHHCCFSVDLPNAEFHLFVDDVSDITSGGIVGDGDVDFADTNHAVGGTPLAASRYVGDLADLYLNFAEYVDLSVTANRRKFVGAGAASSVDLGADGSVPTGTAPIIYLSGATASWHTNDGTGEGFSINGTLTNASVDPPDDEVPAAVGGGYLDGFVIRGKRGVRAAKRSFS